MTNHIHCITAVDVPAAHVLHVAFADGAERTVDLTPMLRGPVFGPLRDPVEFARAAVAPECGVVVWPCGADMDPGVLRDWDVQGPRMAELAAGW